MRKHVIFSSRREGIEDEYDRFSVWLGTFNEGFECASVMETSRHVDRSIFYAFFVFFGSCHVLSLAAILICAAVSNGGVGPHEVSLRFLHTVPVTSWEMAAPVLQPRRTAMPGAVSSPFVTFSSLSVSPGLQTCFASIYFPSHSFSCTGFTLLHKQQLFSSLHVWQCEVTIVTMLIRFQFDVTFRLFLRYSSVAPQQHFLFCLFLS